MIIDYAEPGMILGQDVIDEYGKLLLEQGITLTESYINRLKKFGINTIRIFDQEATQLKQQQQVIPSELRTELSLCFQALSSLQTSFLANEKLTFLYLEQIGNLINNIIDQASQQATTMINTQIYYPNQQELVHSINVCLLSLITGFQLNMSKDDLYELALGALLHDIGKATLPRINGLLFDSAKLHTLYGRNLLLRNKLSPKIARIVAEHHEALDGSGLPLGLTNNKIHLFSKIVAIANFFDKAITKAIIENTSQLEVIEGMLAKSNTIFDVHLLTIFIHTIPIYPVGSLVLLNTKQVAHVTKNHQSHLLRPEIKLNTKRGKVVVNLRQEPNLAISKVIEY
jgi:putative nucleotidyltransferase with HDIG domain